MSLYAQLSDISDTAIRVNQDLLDRAEAKVNTVIAGKGYDVALINEGTPFLKELTVLMAGKIAALEQANATDSPLLQRYKDYCEEIDYLLLSISNKALGITDPNAPVGEVYVGLC